MKTIAATKARKQFFQLITDNAKPGQSTTISVDGEPKVVMLSYDDFNSWVETLEVMSDDQLMKDIRAGEEDIKKGRTVSLEELEKKFEKKK